MAADRPSAYDALVAAIAAITPPTGSAATEAATVLRFWALAHGLAMLRLAGRITAVVPDEAFLRTVLTPVVAGLWARQPSLRASSTMPRSSSSGT